MHYEAPEGWQPRPIQPREGKDVDAGLGTWKPSPTATEAKTYRSSLHLRSGGYKEPIAPLREMAQYGMNAPSLGQLPEPYTQSQYTVVGPLFSLMYSTYMLTKSKTFLSGFHSFTVVNHVFSYRTWSLGGKWRLILFVSYSKTVCIIKRTDET